ncbi:MAG: hypothetical protein AUG08_13735 [Acidobacteria bacterium 13_1_20CM_2_55_15]|nr:MAG: hypothetical protein AUI91_03540 [Acidobacteria bacterium 13_1_40CM_3_56_11]OLD71120.1 MAG: hypothetical protein AUI45_02545 [Acidobacteria bacterium 13_1_40CM_2_56_11]OLE86798.1 MAG: hypothetical protein AUG08_13735 [Acidobacteria bacterium 13_1_20CM_2_55_15]
MPRATDKPSNLVIDLRGLDDIRIEEIPHTLALLAAAQAQLAARLLQNGVSGSNADVRNDGLLTANQASKKCGFSVDWLYRHSQSLPFVIRVGRSLRFSEAGLEKWIRSRSGR